MRLGLGSAQSAQSDDASLGRLRSPVNPRRQLEVFSCPLHILLSQGSQLAVACSTDPASDLPCVVRMIEDQYPASSADEACSCGGVGKGPPPGLLFSTLLIVACLAVLEMTSPIFAILVEIEEITIDAAFLAHWHAVLFSQTSRPSHHLN